MPTLYPGSTVVIKTSFSGSVEGIVNLLGAPNPAGVTQPAYLNPGSPSSNFDTATGADIIFSDVVQETTDYAPPTWTALDGDVVGVVTFGWFRGLSTSASTLSNITGQQASALIPNGSIAKSLFTGVTSDASTPVYLLGRNALSVTRLVTQADCGWGANSAAISYYPTNINNTISIVQDVAATPGYSSGSGLRTGLASTTTEALIGYMSINDGQSIISRNLSYNGVSGNPAGTFKDDVRNGRYSLWSYQNVFYKANLSASKKTLFKGTTAPATPLTSNGLIKAIDTTLASDYGNVQLSTMNVSRPSDGASITP
jgi:hypothetical protein